MVQVLYPGLPSIFLFVINNSNYSHHLLRGYNLPGTCLLIALAHLVPQTPTDGLSVCAFHMGKLSPRTAVLARANRSWSQPGGLQTGAEVSPGGLQTGAEVNPGVCKPEPKSTRGSANWSWSHSGGSDPWPVDLLEPESVHMLFPLLPGKGPLLVSDNRDLFPAINSKIILCYLFPNC